MTVYLEHANLHVRDVDAMLKFLKTAFPGFGVRHDSGVADPQRWVHFGDKRCYLAIYLATGESGCDREPYSNSPGVNHLGFVVEDVEGVRRRLEQAGYRETTVPNAHPARKRIYFNDDEGNDWEFVEYFTENPEQRNDYAGE